MSKERLEYKVGIFVLIGLILAAVLMVSFSKGTLFVKPTYEIFLKTSNVGGIKSRASVLMSGVPVGYVEDVQLTEDNFNVLMKLKILGQYKIRKNSRFVIEQSGFLGDQYIAIYATNQGPFLVSGEIIECEEPFNLQETARAAALFIKRVEDTVTKANSLIERIDVKLLTDQNFSNISQSLANLSGISESTVQTVHEIETLLRTNTVPVSLIISNLTHISTNLVVFIGELNDLIVSINNTLSTNEENITLALRNTAIASSEFTNLLGQLQSGKGIASALLKDAELKENVDGLLKNMDSLTANLTIASSNLNRYGLWWMLWKPKYPKTNQPPTQPKTPSAPLAPIPRRNF
ncbi:MAG TPA: MlaD family protein [Verrucomicrobiota bacterium]|nr:MlaD family protein [Verrucomicrobiota bacterium]